MRWLAVLSILGVVACARQPKGPPATAFVGARLIDGTGGPVIEDAALVVQGGRVVAAGARSDVPVPRGATVVDLTSKIVIPGLINAHGHAGDTRGLEAGHYSEENVLAQLSLYARYGVTTVMSLGGDGAECEASRRAGYIVPEPRPALRRRVGRDRRDARVRSPDGGPQRGAGRGPHQGTGGRQPRHRAEDGPGGVSRGH